MANTPPKAQRPANQDAKPSARPVARFGYLNTTVSVFRNQVKTKEGRAVDAYNVSVSRSYMSDRERVFLGQYFEAVNGPERWGLST